MAITPGEPAGDADIAALAWPERTERAREARVAAEGEAGYRGELSLKAGSV